MAKTSWEMHIKGLYFHNLRSLAFKWGMDCSFRQHKFSFNNGFFKLRKADLQSAPFIFWSELNFYNSFHYYPWILTYPPDDCCIETSACYLRRRAGNYLAARPSTSRGAAAAFTIAWPLTYLYNTTDSDAPTHLQHGHVLSLAVWWKWQTEMRVLPWKQNQNSLCEGKIHLDEIGVYWYKFCSVKKYLIACFSWPCLKAF